MSKFQFENGFYRANLTPPKDILESVKKRDWGQVDHLCGRLVKEDGALFQLLYPLAGQSRIEFIINVRDAKNSWEEDGIWHDDGSRILAFSMGLNLAPETIKGGELLIRPKGVSASQRLGPPAIGEVVIFKTGVDGFEHKVLKVEQGQRVVMAGWCYQ
ncbi:MAG: 2OG-Fe(II) oxygenase [Bacteriovoracaceae bacterium]